jgi:hypothetical protein
MLKLRQERHSWTFEAGSRNRGAVLLYRGCDGHEAGIVVVKRNVYSATHDFTMQSRQHERARPEEIEKELGVVVIVKVIVVLRVGNARPRDSTTIRASILI